MNYYNYYNWSLDGFRSDFQIIFPTFLGKIKLGYAQAAPSRINA